MRIEAINLTGSADLVAVRWLGIEVHDQLGAVVTGFTLDSTSGIDWTRASVPEPGRGLLLVLGGLWVVRPRYRLALTRNEIAPLRAI